MIVLNRYQQQLTESLVATRRWSLRAARLGIRADFKCEYCDRELLADADTYRTWQEDHIIPRTKGGDLDDEENLAVSCRECNVSFKGRWDPRPHAGETATRDKLIETVRLRVKQQRAKLEKEVEICQNFITEYREKSGVAT